MLKNIDKIFVAHYDVFNDRKIHICNQLKKYELKFEFECREPNHDLFEYYTTDQISFLNKSLFMPNKNVQYRILKKSEISLAYKHIKIYEKIAQKQYSNTLILEDDIVLCDDFINQINLFLEKTPNEWDVIFPGICCDLHIPENEMRAGQVAYKKQHPASRCTDSYIIKNSAVKKILSTIKPFNFPIDWELSYQMNIHKLNVFWFEPALINQGSQIGLFDSKIQ